MFRSFPAVLVFLLPTLCYAWGGEGHQLVALIAENQLTPQAKAMIKELLRDANISDAEIASWADEIRRDQRETAPWHFVNIPADAEAFDRTRDANGTDNIVDAIEAQELILVDKSQPKEKRADALKWIVHLIGDVHQPLHCADRNGDKGGNKRLVMFLDQHKADSLHYVWDTGIVRELIAKRRIADVGDTLAKTITLKQRKEWGRGTPEQWADESHGIAVKVVYAGVAADGPPPTLDRAYVQKMTPIVAEELKRGGVRLAMSLNAAAK